MDFRRKVFGLMIFLGLYCSAEMSYARYDNQTDVELPGQASYNEIQSVSAEVESYRKVANYSEMILSLRKLYNITSRFYTKLGIPDHKNRFIASISEEIANAYSIQGKYDESINEWRNATYLMESNGDFSSSLYVHLTGGLALELCKQHHTANEGLRLFTALHSVLKKYFPESKTSILNVYYNIVICLDANRQFDEALRYIDEIESWARIENLLSKEEVLYIEKQRISLRNRDGIDEKEIESLKLRLKEIEKNTSSSSKDRYNARFQLGLALSWNRFYKDAIKVLEPLNALTRGDSLVSRREFSELHSVLAQSYLGMGDFANAEIHSKLLIEANRDETEFEGSTNSISFGELMLVRSFISNRNIENSAVDSSVLWLHAQAISRSGSGRALARSTAIASLDTTGRQLALAWERAKQDRQILGRQIDEAGALTGKEGAAERAKLGRERLRLDALVQGAEEAVRKNYPKFFELINPSAVSVNDLQVGPATTAFVLNLEVRIPLLRSDEALILVTPGDTGLPKGEQRGIVFAVTREGVAWTEIGAEPEALVADVCRMRSLLDPGNVTACEAATAGTLAGAGTARSSTTAGAAVRAQSAGPVPTGAQRGYDRATARRVYDALFGSPEIAKLIAGKSEWIISPQGVLLSLPFAALVTGDYTGDDADVAALRATPWLGLTKALSVIPEVSSLKALRGLSRPARATQTPFFGMGDPDFARGAGTTSDEETRSAVASAALPGQARGYFRDAGADIGAVSKLARLRGTKIEIEALAKSLGAAPGSILLGDDATEGNLRARSDNDSLAKARVVAFATHGLIAGDLGRSLAQPALAFTPPAPSAGPVTEANDGLLTASEAATLRLGADWVILSACNTAAGNGNNSADGLTGLARAFFYAGADTLLVSHWRVRDDAAARLTTRAVEIAATTGSQGTGSQKPSRAAALQQSMKELMNDTSQDSSGKSFAHPSAWAPFTIIGVER
ncbi:MAG: CHAT domain-containing protein [Polymorphobacter sp.]